MLDKINNDYMVKLLSVINDAQSACINQRSAYETFNAMLEGLLQLSESEYGFIGEVLYSEQRVPYLKTYAITNLAWNEQTRSFYDQHVEQGIEFFNLETLFGHVLKTGELVIANDPENDSRGAGIPTGHPDLRTFLGLPIYNQDLMIGMVGIANRPSGYDQGLVEQLQVFLTTCANLINAYRARRIADDAEKKIKDSEIRHRTVLNTIIDGIITIDEEGTIQRVNPVVERIFGYSEAELLGEDVRKLMPDQYSEQHTGEIKRFIQTGVRKVIGMGREFEGLRKDGSTFPIELGVNEMWLGGKRFFTGVVRDISERRRMENVKNEFIAVVSHELRTPLTSIRGSLGLLVGGVGEVSDETRALLNIAYNNTERLLLLINDLLDIEKISSGKMEFQFDELDIMTVVHDALKENAGYADHYGVHFAVLPCDPDLKVYGDRMRLIQVMSNLLSNAAKFSPKGTDVRICAKHVSGFVRVSVSDNGPGVEDAFRDKLFEKFTQADSSSTRMKGGTGLGLAISKEIIAHHQGRIDFKTEVGKGSTFYFEIPLYVPQKGAPDGEDTVSEASPIH